MARNFFVPKSRPTGKRRRRTRKIISSRKKRTVKTRRRRLPKFRRRPKKKKTRKRRQKGGFANDTVDPKWTNYNLSPSEHANMSDEMARLNKVDTTKKSGLAYDLKNHPGSLPGTPFLYTVNNVTQQTTVLDTDCRMHLAPNAPDIPTSGYKTIDVIWVRHCHSCANAAGDRVADAASNPAGFTSQKMREPLCTALGIRQSIDAGFYLLTFLEEAQEGASTNKVCVKFFSSYLPRTFETAKLMASSLYESADLETPHTSSSSKIVRKIDTKIKRICNVSEELKPYEKMANDARQYTRRAKQAFSWLGTAVGLSGPTSGSHSGKGTQSSTTLAKSNCHADYINDNLAALSSDDENDGFVNISKEDKYPRVDVPNTDSACGIAKSEVMAGSPIDQLACDYKRFLESELRHMADADSECKTYNVVVSHGGYIRHCVLQSSSEHPANTQMYHVRYHIPEGADATTVELGEEDIPSTLQPQPTFAEILRTQPIPGMASYLVNPPAPPPPELYKLAGSINSNCQARFREHICPDREP